MILDPQRRHIDLIPVTVATASPLTVTFPDGSTHSAMGVVGLSYGTSGAYAAFWPHGGTPIVFPVGTTSSTGAVIDGNA